mgnify:CR=1 FL=1
MNYIVFDLEWNQCPYGKEQENERIPFEIVEIGAVKLNEERQVTDQFQILIQPRVYKKLHRRTQEIIRLNMKELEAGKPFYKAIREFLGWCGEDFRFCTWGNSDLIELQRNMRYYGVLQLLKGPIVFCDVQKLFSLDKEDGESRKSLEHAVDAMGLKKQKDFHRALSDAWYTAQVFAGIDRELSDTFTSIDCFQNPREKKDEIHVIYPGYEKYISREFDSREEMMEDREITASRCFLCDKNVRKKIRWFASGGKNYYCLARCPRHGWLKGKLRTRKAEDGKYYAVKTMKLVEEEEAQTIRDRKEEIKKKRREKRRLEKKREKQQAGK